VSADATYCLEAVRAGAKDRFLASLFAPDDRRPALLALYAFDIEIARIAREVSEPRLGDIRLQWWRETVTAIASGGEGAHPVARELARAIAIGHLPEKPFLDLIDARAFDLYADPIPDLTTLEAYLGETRAALIQMAALSLAGPAARAAAEAAGLAGVAEGMAHVLRDLARTRARGQVFLPQELTVPDAAAHGLRRLTEARRHLADIPPVALPAFLPAGLAGLHLDRVRRKGEAATPPSQFRRQIWLWWEAKHNRF